VAVTLLILPASAQANHLGTDHGTSTTEISLDEATPEQLRAIVEELGARNDELAADNTSLQQTIDALSTERDDLARSLARFDQAYDALEADRQLLFELRKGLPETRPEAQAQLDRMRSLALLSNPAGLGQIIDRVTEAAPAFLEWRFTEFGSMDEASQAYIDTGANAFDSSMTEFRNEVLMSVANRLDGLLTVIDRAR
jgi:ABC-type transporter Mla subunit MlaD